ADREGDPAPEAVVMAALPPLLDQPRGLQLIQLETCPLATGQHLVPGARRHPHPEAAQHLLPQPPALQVLPRLLGLRRLPEVALVELRGPLEQLPEPRLPPATLLGPRVLVLPLQLDPVALGKRLGRRRELQPL